VLSEPESQTQVAVRNLLFAAAIHEQAANQIAPGGT
jgi:hypothetical protein